MLYFISAADMHLYVYSCIGFDGVKAVDVIQALASAKAAGVNRIYLHLNCDGGDVAEGNAIYNALKSSGLEIIGRVDGVAYSMGGYLLFACSSVEMAQNAMLMFHEVRGSAYGKSSDLMTTAQLMDKMNDSFASQAAQKTGMTEEEFRAKIKTDWYLSAAEALALKFADKIYDASVDMEEEFKEPADIYAQFKIRLTAQLNKIQNPTSMKNIALFFGLPDTATEEQVMEAAKTQKANYDALMKARAENLVQAAIDSGKVKAEAKGAMVALATSNYEQAETIIGSIAEPKANTITRMIAQAGGQQTPSNDGGLVKPGESEGDAFRRLEKENPKALLALKKSGNEAYSRMRLACYPPEVN